MRRFGLLGVLLVGLMSVTLLRPALAVDTWCYEFDFTVSDGGFSGPYGSWSGGGWEGTSAGTGVSIVISKSFSSATITHMEMDVSFAGTGNVAGLIGDTLVINAINSGTNTFSWDGELTDTSVTLNPSSGSDQGAQVTLTRASFRGTGDNPFGDSNCDIPPETPEWTRPLRESDEVGALKVWDNFSLIEALTSSGGLPDIATYIAAPTQYRVYAASVEAGAPVMTAQGGTVTDIVYASAEMCSVWGANPIFGNSCWFSGSNSTSFFELYQFPVDFSVQQVTIELDDGTQLRYMVANANKYVKLGQHVNEGCVIGETIQANEAGSSQVVNVLSTIVANFTNTLGLIEAGPPDSFGIAMVEHRDPDASFEMIQLLPNLTVYNTDAQPCNIDPNFQDCLVSDPDLKHGADAWTFFGDASASDAGVELRPDAYIEQVVNVPEATDFTFRIGVYYDLLDLLGGGAATDRVLTVRVGAFSDTITVPASDQYQEFTVSVPAPDPDPGGLGFTVRIANTGGGGGVILQGACLATTDHTLNPRMCYFANSDFDSLEGWTSTTTQTGAGFVNLGDLDYVSQDITLEANPDDTPRTYHLLLDVRIIAAPGQTIDTSTGTATMFYAWEGTNTVGTLDLTWNQPGEPGYPDAYQTLSTDITVTEHSSDTFYISSGIDGNDTIHIALSRACITTDDTPPGSGVGGPFQTTCSTIPVPTDDSIGTWTLFHWRNLDKFFNCKLMVLLNRWFKLFDEFRRTTLLVFRWGIAFIHKAVDWSITLMWWLNGHFRNIAMGQVTTINESGGCHDIFCSIVDVVTTLGNLLTPVVNALNNVVGVLISVFISGVNLFFTLITGLVGFVVALIIRLVQFLQTAGALFTGIIGAYNSATPTAIPGLPLCATDPTSSLICTGVWVTDNTIFQGRWGTLFVLILSIASIHLILWAVSEFKQILLKTWGSS